MELIFISGFQMKLIARYSICVFNVFCGCKREFQSELLKLYE